ncbi:thiol:disulfide interchange protein DsbD [Pricia antarctica]|uniref:Thiol:disulfide interchange protein DsbD n=1 Tax=Pricia antarctica TaxID=641691 RepID=A0A1G7C7V0_9FLAO|nr:cytochrome c biogenesis protein CcdA [Pricia antarctica]SDE35454.1 thiol:disulfide interchange protein DsbD [Pricia antarctica]
MKKIIFCAILLHLGALRSQTIDPVQWNSSIIKISDTDYNLIIEGTIDKNWHLYSQFTDEGGSLPTEFDFLDDEGNYETVGKVQESKTETAYNDTFEVKETFFTDQAKFTQHIKLVNPEFTKIEVLMHYQVCNDVCISKEKKFAFSLGGSSVAQETAKIDDKSIMLAEKLRLNLKNKSLLLSSNGAQVKEVSMLRIFILGFLGGLVALFTPCVFPMIPLTVSFFTKHSSNKKKGITNAMFYGFFIVLIYLGLSIPFHFLDSLDPEILNSISTNVWLNVFFFIIFVVFAFSFFGYYEITLPHRWSNKMDSASQVGGFVGIFFMALTLVLVSFSCTGPILGSLLAGSLTANQGAMQLTIGMGGFGMALALPFALFALFPRLLESLPKSGGWLTTVKVVLGFVELALAFKFLSNADLVAHWGFLKREVFIGIWVVIFSLLALYFFGCIKFPHESRKKLNYKTTFLGICIGGFVIYLISGIQKDATLKLLSGFPPPSFYSLYTQPSDCPLGLNCFKDFDKGLAIAKAEGKPILLDFTGWACVNCRKMEENVWSDPRVYSMIKDNYVLISLYIDDRKALEKKDRFRININSDYLKSINTVGDKWATFQYLNFDTASQPYYVTMSPDLKILNSPKQYANTEEYYSWLKESL